MHALGFLTLILAHRQSIAHRDPLDHQHPIAIEHLADRLGLIALRIDVDLTRLQRAGEGASQSTTRGRDHVVERGGVGREPVGIHAVVRSHLRMHAERDGPLLGWQVREPLRTAETLDADLGDIGWLLGHHWH